MEEHHSNVPPWSGTFSTRILAELDKDMLLAPPDDMSPDAPPHPSYASTEEVRLHEIREGDHVPLRSHEASEPLPAMPPKAPEEPIAPPPPEINVESEIMPGWPRWLVEELEIKHEQQTRQVVDEENYEEGGMRGVGGAEGGYRTGEYGSSERMDEERQSFDGPSGATTGSCASEKFAKFPLLCACCFLVLFLLPVLIGLFGIPFIGINRLDLTIETTFDAFLQTDVPAAVALQSFQLALADQPGSDARRLHSRGASAAGSWPTAADPEPRQSEQTVDAVSSFGRALQGDGAAEEPEEEAPEENAPEEEEPEEPEVEVPEEPVEEEPEEPAEEEPEENPPEEEAPEENAPEEEAPEENAPEEEAPEENAPEEEAPEENAPEEEAPEENAPEEEAPEENAPEEEAPEEEAPEENAPEEEAPEENAPEEEAPAEENPAEEEEPQENPPEEEAPQEENPEEEEPQENPAEEEPQEENPAEEEPQENPAEEEEEPQENPPEEEEPQENPPEQEEPEDNAPGEEEAEIPVQNPDDLETPDPPDPVVEPPQTAAPTPPPETGIPYSAVRDLTLYYVLEDTFDYEGGNLVQNRMGAIARFEQILKSLPKWKDLCSRAQTGSGELCEPGVSLANYGRATWGRVTEDDLQPNALRFDGRGRNPLNMPSALYLGDVQLLSSVFLPMGVNALPGSTVAGQLDVPFETWQVPDVQMIRSVFRFRIFCCSQDSSSLDERRDFNDRIDTEWNAFLRDDVIPLTNDWTDHGLRVYIDGTGVSTTEVKLALWGDIWLAVGSMVFVHVYLLIHTCSFLLSVIGPLLAAFALPLAFVVCGLIFGTTTVSFASALALFLTVGFGADVILVYTDFWRASARRRAKEADRLAWTYRHAGGASFATTATTALSFFANLASAIRALRQFAFLMGLCVVFAWILISLIYTPLCIFNERLHRRLFEKGHARRLATEAAFNAKILTKTVTFLHKGRFFVVLISLIALSLFIGLSIPNFAIGTSLPLVFPEDHNRARVTTVATNFESVSNVFPLDFKIPTMQKNVCQLTAAPNGVTPPTCHLNWCVASQSSEGGTEGGRCSCWRKHDDANVCGERNWIRGVTRIVGVGTLTGQQIQQVTSDRLQWDGRLPWVLKSPTRTGTTALSPLLMQDWLTGDVELMPFTQAWGQYRKESWRGICSDFQDICFCSNSTYVCDFAPGTADKKGWTKVDDFVLSTEARRVRQLAMVPATVPTNQQTKVRVGWGMWIRDTSPLIGDQTAANSWGYVDTFRPENPWTQRTMFKFCDELPVALLVTQKWCWMEDFRTWLTGTKGQAWPTLNFHPLALEFADTTFPFYGTSGRQYLWVDSNAIRAFYNTFMIDVPKGTKGTAALEHKGNWDAYVNHFKDLADSEGSGALGIFHVSQLWAEAEQESELVRSTMVTITIVLVLAFVGMLIFTRSLVLSSYVVLATIQVMAGLIFFITVIMQWKVGLIEVIAVIYFVGYAVTYPLHVAHKYADAEALQMSAPVDLNESNRKRYMRTKWALRSIGGAALGSAMTTAGASLFLVFCTLNVFGKLGAMCLAVTVLSILTALGPLPALLLICGPPRPGVCDHGR